MIKAISADCQEEYFIKIEVTQLKYTFLFYRKERKGKRKVPQRYILRLCALCGSFYNVEIPNVLSA